ncbi:MAG: cobalamin-independent methionine synthase II family protein, partial [Chloroflexota bacterium]
DALRKHNKGQLGWKEFNTVADKAVLEALEYQEEAGLDIVSDGEQRRDNFYSFVVEKLDGVRLMSLAEIMDVVEDKASFEAILKAADAPAWAIHNPTVVGKVKPKMRLALDEYEFMRQHTKKHIKIPLPGPYILARSMWVKGITDQVYESQEELAADLVDILRDELIALRDAGCDFVQFDEPVLTDVVFNRAVKERTFMCASMSEHSGDPQKELLLATRMMNSITEGVDGVRTGVHICRGNWTRQEVSLLKGSYEPLVPAMMGMKIDQLVLEYATPRAGELGAFAHHPKQKEIGLGVTNPRSDDIETSESIVARVKDARKFFEPEQIFLNPDCGFGTFAERPMNPADVAYKKLAVMVDAAKELRKGA